MENSEIKELLLDLKKGQDKLFKGQEELFKGQDKLFKGQEELFKGQKELFEGQEETRVSIRDLQRGQEELFKGQKELFEGQEETRVSIRDLQRGQDKLFKEMDNLSLSVARIEADHGEKLGILLDVVTSHINKFDSENERIEKCEKRLDKHDHQFFALNSKVHAY